MNPYAAPSSGKVVTFDLVWARDAIPMCKIGNTGTKHCNRAYGSCGLWQTTGQLGTRVLLIQKLKQIGFIISSLNCGNVCLIDHSSECWFKLAVLGSPAQNYIPRAHIPIEKHFPLFKLCTVRQPPPGWVTFKTL